MQLVSTGAERVRLDYIRTCAYVFRVDLAHKVRIAKIQFVVAAIDIDTLGIEHRTHRTINDVDTVGFEDVSERFHSRNCRF